jgi:hypothetical protein
MRGGQDATAYFRRHPKAAAQPRQSADRIERELMGRKGF